VASSPGVAGAFLATGFAGFFCGTCWDAAAGFWARVGDGFASTTGSSNKRRTYLRRGCKTVAFGMPRENYIPVMKKEIRA
jgi:hypothetical protein